MLVGWRREARHTNLDRHLQCTSLERQNYELATDSHLDLHRLGALVRRAPSA